MSSMRNAVQRRNHKERAQPHSREKLGILEKHKDYKLRAKDFNEKKRRLKVLRQKAAERNPDEFHFAMMKSRTDSAGRKVADRGNQVLSHEAVQLLKTQDAGYLRTMLAKTRKDIQKLGQSIVLDIDEDDGETAIVLPGLRQTAKKTIFADDAEEQEMTFGQRVGGRHGEDEDNEDQGEASDGDDDREDPTALKARKQNVRSQAWREARMEALRKREHDLAAAESALSLERARMSNSIGGVNKNGVRFKVRDRKR